MINYSGTSEQLEEGIKTLTLVERERLQHPQIHSEVWHYRTSCTQRLGR